MRELTQEYKDTVIEIVEAKEQRKEIKLIGQQRKIKGLTLYEFNEKTKILQEAKFKPMSIFISASLKGSDTVQTYKCVVNEYCIYFQALNKKNAETKLRKAKLLP